MGEIENIAAQILMGYADIVKQTGSLLQPDANISLDQYLKVREIAKKEKYMYKDAFVSGSTSVEENRVPEKKNNRSSPDVGKFYTENNICYNQQNIENDTTKTAVNTNINADTKSFVQQKPEEFEDGSEAGSMDDEFDESAIFAGMQE
jgi:hypothetical protein